MNASLTAADVIRRIASVGRWYHRMELCPGVFTPGINNTPEVLNLLDLPADGRGLRVLDLGTADGFFAFEMERRGAEVVAIDFMPPEENGFATAAELLGSRVPYVQDNVYRVSPAKYGTFDIVLFLGLLYHMPDPFEALRIVRTVCRGTL